MKILICPSHSKEKAKEFVLPIAEFFQENGITTYIDEQFTQEFSLPTLSKNESVDIILTLGGDGTILYYKHKYLYMEEAKIASVNLGSLGFMAAIRIEDFTTYLRDLIEGKYHVEKRLMLEVQGPDKKTTPIINDVVAYRSKVQSMIMLKLSIDDSFVNLFQCDGLIFATPTGSTAYSLAAGGPILSPDTNSLCITPIAPHTLTTRPIVVPSSANIRLEYLSKKEDIEIMVDGLHSYGLNTHESLEIRESSHTFSLITFPHHDNYFFANLRQKLRWSGMAANNGIH